MLRKISGITFDRTEIQKATTRNRKPSSFWPVSSPNYTENANHKLSKREDICFKGSVLMNRECND